MGDTTIDYIRIFPGIGIIRVGNSPEHFIGPEAPGVVPNPGHGKYKDAAGAIKRQAARFRVYGYKNGQTEPVAEITDAAAEVTWKVEMANRKAANYAFQGKYAFNPGDLRNANIQGDLPVEQRDQLTIAPAPETISGRSAGPIPLRGGIFQNVGPHQDGTGLCLPGLLEFDPPQPSRQKPVPVTYRGVDNVCIGTLYTDPAGRLVVAPGAGVSESVTTPKVVISKVAPISGQQPSTDPEINGNSYFNNPGWYDDTGDGRVSATVTFPDGTTLTTEGNGQNGDAWVFSAPTKYAPANMNVVSLYDVMLEVFPDSQPYKGKKCNFYRDIHPTLLTVVNYAWVNAAAFSAGDGRGHGPSLNSLGDMVSPIMLSVLSDPSSSSKSTRERIFNLIRPPWENQPGAKGYNPCAPWKSADAKHLPPNKLQMPKLYGDGGSPEENQFNGTDFPQQWLNLTTHQYDRFEQWASGNFEVGTPPGKPLLLEQLPLAEQPAALDKAALEPCVGGGFHPGIELTYNTQCPETYGAAFRIAEKTIPGSVSAYMSIPWQGDFWSCNTHWWPANRPDIWVNYDAGTQARDPFDWFSGTGLPAVGEPGYEAMVSAWHLLGFIVPDTSVQPVFGQQVLKQVERDPSLGPGTPAIIPSGD